MADKVSENSKLITIERPQNRNGAPTLMDVALLAGTSKGTASRALNGKHWVAPETRAAVLRASKKLGFQADPTAQRLANGRDSTLVGLFTFELDLGVVTRKIQILQRMLTGHGYIAPIYAYGYNVESGGVQQSTLLTNLIRQRPGAIVCNVSNMREKALADLKQYRDDGGVLVTYDSEVDLDCDRVVFNRADSADQAASYLLELGHRDIGFAMQSPGPDSVRLKGARRALKKHGLSLHKDWIFDVDAYEAGGTNLARHILKLPQRPTAICTSDDAVAAAFIAEMGRNGVRVPEHLSVIGHDDMPIAMHSTIPLTTVAQPVEAIAHEVVQLLTSRLDGSYEGPERTVTLQGELIVRASTASYKGEIN